MFDPIVEIFGEGTDYEALATLIACDGEWMGRLLFKDERLSPPIPGVAIRFLWITPGAANGAIGVIRAENYWKQLVAIFTALRAQPGQNQGDGGREGAATDELGMYFSF